MTENPAMLEGDEQTTEVKENNSAVNEKPVVDEKPTEDEKPAEEQKPAEKDATTPTTNGWTAEWDKVSPPAEIEKVETQEQESEVTEEEKDFKPPIKLCSLIVRHPKTAFGLGIGFYFLMFAISGLLMFRKYDLFPVEFTYLPLIIPSDLYLQRWYALQYAEEADTNMITRVPESLFITSNRSLTIDRVELIFEVPSGQNVFTKERLTAMQAIENAILNAPNFGQYCKVNTTSGGCAPPISPLNYFDGTFKSENATWDDPNFNNIAEVLYTAYVNRNHVGNMRQLLGKDATVTPTSVVSPITRILFRMGYPLEEGGSRDDQSVTMRTYLAKNVLPIIRNYVKAPPAGMTIIYYSTLLFVEEVQAQAFKDMALAGGSFFFIFIFVCIQTRSFWIGGWAMFSIIGSFICTNLIYRCIIGFRYFGFFHILSIFIILGIGADDVFLFMDTWRDTAHQNYPSLEHRFSETYRRAAVAMAVTSITTMMAFLVSAFSPLLAINSFGVFSAILVLIDYCAVITFFPAVVMMHHKHVSKCCTCCDRQAAVSPMKEGEAKKGQKNVIVRFFKGPYFRFVTNKVARWIILVVFAALVGVMIYFVSQLKPEDESVKIYKPGSNYDLAAKRRLYSFMPSSSDRRVSVTLLWGLKPQDTSSCHFSDHECTGIARYDSAFSMESAAAQLTLSQLCKTLENLTSSEKTDLFVHVDSETKKTDMDCFMTNFEAYLASVNLSLPLNETNVKPVMQANPHIYGNPLNITASFNRYFEVMIMRWLTSGYTFKMTEDFSTYNDLLGEASGTHTQTKEMGQITAYWGTELRYVGILINTTLNARALGYPTGLPVAAAWEAFFTEKLSTYPAPLKPAFQASRTWSSLTVQKQLADNAINGLMIGIALALVILTVTTLNVLVALVATICIAAITTCVVAIIPIAGWKLGILESLNMVLVVGLAVDYVVHLSEAYNHSKKPDRLSRVEEALERVGISVLSGAITTLGAAFFMLFAEILFFVQFGIFMFCTIGFSFFFAIAFFTTFMALAGPEGDIGSLTALWRKIRRK